MTSGQSSGAFPAATLSAGLAGIVLLATLVAWRRRACARVLAGRRWQDLGGPGGDAPVVQAVELCTAVAREEARCRKPL